MADRSRKQPNRPRDFNQRAASTVARATGEESDDPVPETTEVTKPTSEERHNAAVALGRLGGKKGGPARAKKMTAEQRSDSARKAAVARWGSKR